MRRSRGSSTAELCEGAPTISSGCVDAIDALHTSSGFSVLGRCGRVNVGFVHMLVCVGSGGGFGYRGPHSLVCFVVGAFLRRSYGAVSSSPHYRTVDTVWTTRRPPASSTTARVPTVWRASYVAHHHQGSSRGLWCGGCCSSPHRCGPGASSGMHPSRGRGMAHCGTWARRTGQRRNRWTASARGVGRSGCQRRAHDHGCGNTRG